MFDLQTEIAVCPGCSAECEAVRFGGALRYFCEHCAQAEKERRRQKDRKAECMELWRTVTPDEFQIPVNPEKLHDSLRPALECSGLEGVGMVGVNSSGKTRVGYWLLRKAAMHGLRPYAITASLFRQSASDRSSNDVDVRGQARMRLQAARYAGVLLLDDVGKGAKTEGADEALYELLTHRRDNHLATHWTSNGGSKWISERYGVDRGPAIAYRLAHLAGCTTEKGSGRIFSAL